jgi:hypothetical protein
MPSAKAYPDLSWQGGGDDLTVGFLNDPRKAKALEIAKAKQALTPSLSKMGASNPATLWTDADFARLLELQKPLNVPRTQKEVDEEEYLKNKLAASTAEMQLQPMGYKAYPGDAKLTPSRIAQMYPATSDIEAQVAAAKQTPEYQTATNELAAERSRSVQRALEVANQKRQDALQEAYGRDNAMLSPENAWLASAAQSPQNAMLSIERPRTGPLATAEELENPPENLVGSTASGALVKRNVVPPAPEAPAPDNAPSAAYGQTPAGRAPMMNYFGVNGQDISGYRGAGDFSGASWDRGLLSLNQAPLGTVSARNVPSWSSAAQTANEAAAKPTPSPSRSTSPAASSCIPFPPPRPAEFSKPASEEGNQSLLSSILSRLKIQDPYAGKSAKQMYEQAQDMQRSGDESGANILIQRAGQAPDAGMKRGGTAGAGGQKAAGPHKDAALHKALDIIHAMMTRGH